MQGSASIRARMKAGMFGFKFEYFLHIIHRPMYNTLTWTLDYSKRSDIGNDVSSVRHVYYGLMNRGVTDDSVGHWQVEAHPHKKYAKAYEQSKATCDVLFY